MRYSETTLVRLAVVFLMLLGIVIYSLAYSRKPLNNTTEQPNSLFQPNTQSTVTVSNTPSTPEPSTTKSAPILIQKNNPIQLNTAPKPSSDLFKSTSTATTITTNTNTLVPGRSITKISNGGTPSSTPTTLNPLPGSKIVESTLPIVSTLRIDAPLILQDIAKPNIYYIPLDKIYDRDSVARSYNGNTKKIITQSEIQENKLFGQAITYINLPQYAGQLVLMVVTVSNQDRLIQIPFDSYHTSKDHLQKRMNSL